MTRPAPVADARWAPSPGFRVVYREGETLRVVGGDGEDDRLLAENVAPVAPAWRPGEGRTVVAYVSTDGRVRVVEADGKQLWAADPGAAPEQLLWSDDAGLLLVVTAGRRHPLYRAGGRPAGALETPAGQDVLDAAFAPETRDVAYSGVRSRERPAARSCSAASSSSRAGGVWRTSSSRRTEAGSLTGWPEADQLLFLRLPGVSRIVAVPDVRREFDPGGIGATSFPRVAEWCCAAPD